MSSNNMSNNEWNSTTNVCVGGCIVSDDKNSNESTVVNKGENATKDTSILPVREIVTGVKDGLTAVGNSREFLDLDNDSSSSTDSEEYANFFKNDNTHESVASLSSVAPSLILPTNIPINENEQAVVGKIDFSSITETLKEQHNSLHGGGGLGRGGNRRMLRKDLVPDTTGSNNLPTMDMKNEEGSFKSSILLSPVKYFFRKNDVQNDNNHTPIFQKNTIPHASRFGSFTNSYNTTRQIDSYQNHLEGNSIHNSPLKSLVVPSETEGPNQRLSVLSNTVKRRIEHLHMLLSPEEQNKPHVRAMLSSTYRQWGGVTQNNQSRRFKVGDFVLVRNTQSRWTTLVNRYGFPPGTGDTDSDRRGPYQYVLAIIAKLHFEEIKTYYTVTRCDTGADQRADLEFMEPLRTPKGELAAIVAASETTEDGLNRIHHFDPSITKSIFNNHYDDEGLFNTEDNKNVGCFGTMCSCLSYPISWFAALIIYCCDTLLHNFWISLVEVIRIQSRLFLNGKNPYVCKMRFTIINLVVICSMWVMFIDQARLAFFPPSSDYVVAIVNFVSWIILVLELLFQLFIRPDGFQNLIISEKAFTPTTVLFINSFHIIVEALSLLVFIPEFYCILKNESCSQRYPWSFHNAALTKIIGPTRRDVAYAYIYFAIIRLRVIALVRHWRNMWINNTFINTRSIKQRQKQSVDDSKSALLSRSIESEQSTTTDSYGKMENSDAVEAKSKENTLTNACNIGTSLMVINSYRTIASMLAITGLFPLFLCLVSYQKNDSSYAMTMNLHAMNAMTSGSSQESCEFLSSSIVTWAAGVVTQNYGDLDSPSLLTLEMSPYRCGFNESVSTAQVFCLPFLNRTNTYGPDSRMIRTCKLWSSLQKTNDGYDFKSIADSLGIREGSIMIYSTKEVVSYESGPSSYSTLPVVYDVTTSFDHSFSVKSAAFASLLLQICLLIAILVGLSTLRRDAEYLVLGPLRRMLRIVARYAKNPLVPPRVKTRGHTRMSSTDDSRSFTDEDDDDDSVSDDFALGSFETEQLIAAVAKITDLLRKCWGVAGADIISTNLASREGVLADVFNPTVKGKSVYALFGFAAIGGFDNAVRNLGGDIMPLINDIAAVLHGEVFRWGFGDSGQCNKNLGGAFLMVFRIGLVKDVIQKLEEATNVVFNTKTTDSSSGQKRKKPRGHVRSMSATSSSGSHAQSASMLSKSHNAMLTSKNKRKEATKAMGLSLQSLPGIANFTDRAVIGMLKAYAGIYRDKKILRWNDDFRLGAGVGAFSISMIYGMDAGWAVEGAVGSEYKIDATYLSPHVNMASRMTSACKQYGVSIMLSQAVQELMSNVAQSKLRHLDTVTVKGSSVKQKIYTYDARAKGVDFFLYSRSDEQADFDAENVSPSIWNNDQDLKAMRQHITESFLTEFKAGHKAYLAGDWSTALKRLEEANDLMIQTAIDEGYLEDEFDAVQLRVGEDAKRALEELRAENGDGPSIYLMNYIKSHGGVAPNDWDGWHPLTKK